MLEFIRNRAQGIFAWIIIVLIIVPFALWGIQEYLGGGKAVPAATVNGHTVTQAELQTAYQRQRDRLRQMLGKNFRPELFPEASMKRQVLQQLIDRKLLVHAALESGMQVGDAQLAAVVRSISVFQQDGKFSAQRYRQLLARQGTSVGAFEAGVRRDLLVGQLRQGIMESEFVTPRERDEQARLLNQQRDIGVLLLPLDKFRPGVTVSDKEIADYYKKHQGQYIRPEQVKVAYLDLSVAALAKKVTVSDEQMRAYYETHKSSFRTPEQRKARHILFSVPKGANKAQADKALEQAREVRQQIVTGKTTFTKAAKADSDDAGSAKQGGELGWFGRGVMDPAFEKAAFQLQPGQISQPVRSRFGYHLIKVEAARGGKTKSFSEVKDQIAQELRREQAQKRYYDLAESLANMTYEHPDTLQVAADELGLKVHYSGYFSRQGGGGIAADPKVVSAAFSDDVLERGNNSPTIELGDDRLLVLRVADRKPQAERPLAEVHDQIAKQLRQQKVKEAAHQAAEMALKALATGQSPEAVAKAQKGQWKRYNQVKRSADTPQPSVVHTAFAMPHPADKAATWDRVTLPSGDEAVVGVFKVMEPKKVGNEAKAQVAGLTQADQQAAYEAFIDALRASADIEIHGDER